MLKYQRPEQSGFTPSTSTTDRILALCVLVKCQRESRQDAHSLCQSQKGVWFSASWGTLRSSVPPQDPCRDYWTTIWPVLRDWVLWSVAGACPASFLYRQEWGRTTGQNCGPKSLWSICRQHQDHLSCFCQRCSNLCWVAGGSGDGSRSTAWGGKTLRTSGLLDQDY